MAASIESLTAKLAAVTDGHARPATATDDVAGVAAGVVVEPASEEQVAAALALADAEGLKVVPRGGGTQMNLGFQPEAAHIILSTAALHDLVEYNPHDLTVTVHAGMRLVDLQKVLGQSRQLLALDPPLPDAATLGGIIATNATGPLRLRYGGVRDQIIGVRVVTADGTVAKGGGKVVKNVAGYDLPKLFTGSLGTLGVIVAATFRLYPLPAASQTVVITDAAPARLCELAQRVLGSTLEPAKMSLGGETYDAAGASLAVQFNSVAEAVADQAARLAEMAGALGASARRLDAGGEASFWPTRMSEMAPEPEPSDALLLKASVLPADVSGWLERLATVSAELELAARYEAQVGHGIIFVRLSGPPDGLAAAVEPLREAAGPVAERGSLVVWDAPPAVLARVDVWGPSPALAVMRRVKQSFDPKATLNPGRFIGRI
jgi:glycolate dehydrogenase FAD-binding subunit